SPPSVLVSLGSATAELDWFQRTFDIGADFDSGYDFLRLGIKFLLIRLLQAGIVGHYQPAATTFVLASGAINRHTDIGVFLEALFHGRCQSVLECFENHFTRYVFFTR